MEKLPTLEKELEEKLESRVEVVKDKEGRIVDLLVVDDEKRVSLKEFIPQNVTLDSKSWGFAYVPEEKTVRFNPKEADHFMGRLAILHEIAFN